FEKAFESLNWSFLNDTKEQMGFSQKWRKWIKRCLDSFFGSVLVNGSPTKEFKIQKGFHQALHISLQEAKLTNIFKGVEVGHDKVGISHLQFADEALILGSWSLENAKNLCRVLRCFQLSSGLKGEISFGWVQWNKKWHGFLRIKFVLLQVVEALGLVHYKPQTLPMSPNGGGVSTRKETHFGRRICLFQLLAYGGIGYSSPTMASAISNLTPANTFLIAIILSEISCNFLQKFTKLDSVCLTKLQTLAPEVVITHISHFQPSNDASNSASISDSNKRKVKAHERQAAIVAKMKAHQSKLTENEKLQYELKLLILEIGIATTAFIDLLMQYSCGKSALVVCSTRKGAQVLAQTAMNHDYSNPFINSSEQHERLREASLSCGDKQIQSYILYDAIAAATQGNCGSLDRCMLGSVIPTCTWFGAFMFIIGVRMMEWSGSPPCAIIV
nr:putative RNA-directed DNA polymerase, eukaryota, reverse transcriptase zinc-binding domain protein [Tanacetum cinerariifolium]